VAVLFIGDGNLCGGPFHWWLKSEYSIGRWYSLSYNILSLYRVHIVTNYILGLKANSNTLKKNVIMGKNISLLNSFPLHCRIQNVWKTAVITEKGYLFCVTNFSGNFQHRSLTLYTNCLPASWSHIIEQFKIFHFVSMDLFKLTQF
jgi:hypothetical protein